MSDQYEVCVEERPVPIDNVVRDKSRLSDYQKTTITTNTRFESYVDDVVLRRLSARSTKQYDTIPRLYWSQESFLITSHDHGHLDLFSYRIQYLFIQILSNESSFILIRVRTTLSIVRWIISCYLILYVNRQFLKSFRWIIIMSTCFSEDVSYRLLFSLQLNEIFITQSRKHNRYLSGKIIMSSKSKKYICLKVQLFFLIENVWNQFYRLRIHRYWWKMFFNADLMIGSCHRRYLSSNYRCQTSSMSYISEIIHFVVKQTYNV